MSKIILVDGNNILFRSYYATAYTGNMMKTSKGFPTNALYGFINMLNKILQEEKCDNILVAFDKGKTFRHGSFDLYKAGRIEMPSELREQFSKVKEILDNMGIKYYEKDGYEADDIIGTFSSIAEKKGYDVLIVSSDKDLLQLIGDKTKVKLLKTKDYILMDKDTFVKEYSINPDKMIDLKGLQGDPSDNIPGVKGIGEKTALKLLQDYGSIEKIYVNIDNIKGSLKEKLLQDKSNAFMSKELATIYKEVPMDIKLDDTKYKGIDEEKLRTTYEELEFYSLLKLFKKPKERTNKNIIEIDNINDLSNIKGPCSFYIELSESNYHKANILGSALYDGNNTYFISKEMLLLNPNFLTKIEKYTYDVKKNIVVLKKLNINTNNYTFDSMIAGYLLNYNVKDDAAYLAQSLGYDIPFYESITKTKDLKKEYIIDICQKKAEFIYNTREILYNRLKQEDMLKLFNDVEMPLTEVLASMEYEGIRIDKTILEDMGKDIDKSIESIAKEIYKLAGEEFNISSPKQLSDILFNKLMLNKGKKNITGYTTEKNLLIKLREKHPIVDKIIDYRTLSKLKSTYIIGLLNATSDDNKIHTIYNQTLTRTGRLSSIEPNLQNIPIRLDYGRLIRKVFIPEEKSVLLSSDYSQIELRIFAHLSKLPNLLEIFKNDEDIHTSTAVDIFKVNKSEVTKLMRRRAKAVNFGILYGISNYGLSEDLGISPKEAKEFIEAYFNTYPGVKNYMDQVIKEAYKNKYVVTLLGRKRILTELSNTNYVIRQQGERMALNTPIQGTSADILKIAMINIYKEMNKRNLKSKMLLQVHDELIFNALNNEVEELKEIVKEKMENAYKLDVPLKVDIETGDNWYEAK